MADQKIASGAAIDIPKGLVSGLRNYWYPLMLSENLPTDKPVSIRRLGEDLVVWRGHGGKPSLFADYCPHKGAPLSLGRLEVRGRLECWYHGLQYDETGQCRLIPAERQEDGPLTRHYRVVSYPCEERAGFIWGYIGDAEKLPPPPLVLEPEVEGGEYHALTFDLGYIWEAPWPLVMDNNTDAAHAPFLHRDTAAKFIPPEELLDYFTPRRPRVETVDGDIRLGGSRGRHLLLFDDQDLDIQKFFLPHSHRIDVGLGPGFPGQPLRLLIYIVPVDSDSTVYFHHLCVKKTLIDRAVWEQMVKEHVNDMLQAVYRQDAAITGAQRTTERARSGERVLPQDALSVQTRRLILEAYQAQQKALAEG